MFIERVRLRNSHSNIQAVPSPTMKINYYNPNGVRHPRRTRIINTIKAVCKEHGYTYTKGLHILFNQFALQQDKDRYFTCMPIDPIDTITPYYSCDIATFEYQATLWTHYHFNGQNIAPHDYTKQYYQSLYTS